jgi:hypothetical protein
VRSTEPIHVIVRATAGGFYVTSPQAPGLAFGRRTIDGIHGELQDVLAFHFDEPGPFTVIEHHEHSHEAAGHELVTRLAIDDHKAQRQETYKRLRAALSVPEQVEALVEEPANLVGEVLYICVLPSDTLQWVGAQLDPRGESATLVVAVADDLMLSFDVSTGSDTPRSHGLAPDDQTVADLVRTTPIAHASNRPVTLAV